ncbi:MAG: T9SS type A sorting domain-containing protein [Taibaiella sp.]|nr:T9SS type A sorting domain-containing protein [Taibaiella sp.]
MISRDGVIRTVAGTGSSGFIGDGGTASSAQLNSPRWVSIDVNDFIYIADAGNNRIRRIDTFGVITTIAGNGTMASTGDGGSALSASLMQPTGVCLDSSGNVYEVENTRVRKIEASSGIITTIVGNGSSGFSGDGGIASLAQIQAGTVYVNRESGDIYITDFNRVRKINATTNIISTIAGTGAGTYSGDEIPAISANISPVALAWDDTGNIYVAELGNDRVRKIDTAGIIHTIAGTGVAGFSGDGGLATAAQLFDPSGIAFDLCGNLYIAEKENYRIRKVTFNPFSTPTVSATGVTSAAVGSIVTVNATVSGTAGSYTIKWFKNSSLFSTTSVPTVTYTKGPGTDTITARVVPLASYCSDSATSAPHLVAASGVGVEEAIADNGLIVYPSPTAAVLHVSAAVELKQIEVTNLLGQRVIVATCSSTLQELDVSRLPQGVYLVRVNDAWVRRFVKE